MDEWERMKVDQRATKGLSESHFWFEKKRIRVR